MVRLPLLQHLSKSWYLHDPPLPPPMPTLLMDSPLERNLFPVIFVSYDKSFGLITSDLNPTGAVSQWQTSQENSLCGGMEGA